MVAESLTVRSTLLASSREGLFKLGHEARYLEALGDDGESRLREATMASQWLPVALAAAHYGAADALRLPPAEMQKVGNVVGQRLEGALWGSFARLARSTGITPWSVLDWLDGIWGRMYRGDSIAVTRVGPKDAHITIEGNALANIGYWRGALVGLMKGATELFAQTAYVKLEPQDRPGSAVYGIAWA